MGGLLDDAGYRLFLAETHPELGIDDDRLDGVPSFLAPLDVQEPLAPGLLRTLVEWARPVVPQLVTPSALFVGTPFERYDQTSLVTELPPVVELSERIERVARDRALEVAVLTNVQCSALDLSSWLGRGWVVMPSFPDTIVDLGAVSFEAHLKTLPQGDRSGIRRNIKRFDRAGHRLERVEDAAGHGSAIYRCYRPFFERATVRWQPHTEAYFSGLTRLGSEVDLTVARSSNGRLIGFIVAFQDATGVQAGRIGVHPDYYRRDAVYFRLMYHVLEDALVRHGGGARFLSLEPTGYRMKRHMGGHTVSLVNLVLGLSETWWLLLRQFQGLGRRMLKHLEDRSILERIY